MDKEEKRVFSPEEVREVLFEKAEQCLLKYYPSHLFSPDDIAHDAWLRERKLWSKPTITEHLRINSHVTVKRVFSRELNKKRRGRIITPISGLSKRANSDENIQEWRIFKKNTNDNLEERDEFAKNFILYMQEEDIINEVEAEIIILAHIEKIEHKVLNSLYNRKKISFKLYRALKKIRNYCKENALKDLDTAIREAEKYVLKDIKEKDKNLSFIGETFPPKKHQKLDIKHIVGSCYRLNYWVKKDTKVDNRPINDDFIETSFMIKIETTMDGIICKKIG